MAALRRHVGVSTGDVLKLTDVVQDRGAGVDGSDGDIPISATLADVPECSPVRMSMLIWWCPVSLSC
jgi:hypothetical protein